MLSSPFRYPFGIKVSVQNHPIFPLMLLPSGRWWCILHCRALIFGGTAVEKVHLRNLLFSLGPCGLSFYMPSIHGPVQMRPLSRSEHIRQTI